MSQSNSLFDFGCFDNEVAEETFNTNGSPDNESESTLIQYSGFNSALFYSAPEIGLLNTHKWADFGSEGESSGDNRVTTDEDHSSEASGSDFKYDQVEECLEDVFTPTMATQRSFEDFTPFSDKVDTNGRSISNDNYGSSTEYAPGCN